VPSKSVTKIPAGLRVCTSVFVAGPADRGKFPAKTQNLTAGRVIIAAAADAPRLTGERIREALCDDLGL
jgi:hypothetical protein